VTFFLELLCAEDEEQRRIAVFALELVLVLFARVSAREVHAAAAQPGDGEAGGGGGVRDQ